MYIRNLNDFPRVAAPGRIDVCEVQSQFKSVQSSLANPSNSSAYTNVTEDYLHINGLSLKPVLPYKIQAIRLAAPQDSYIITHPQSFVKGLWEAFIDKGTTGILEYLRTVKGTPFTSPLINVVNIVSTVFDKIQQAKRNAVIQVFPHLALESEDVIEAFSPVRNWRTSWVRAMSWHPMYSKLAIALKDDCIRFFTVGADNIPMLKSQEQKCVTSISWRPYVSDEIAVGCEKGVIIWYVACTSKSVKQGSKKITLLANKGHSPVTCVEYSSSGNYLLTSSACDTSIYVYEMTSFENTALFRFGGGGVPLALWSPHSENIFNTTPYSVFRVWESRNNWTTRRWTTASKRIEAACWSPCGSTLLFACDSAIYSIFLRISELDMLVNQTDTKAVPVFDLQECLVKCNDNVNEYKVGGKVRQMDWDNSGTRLALLFDNSEFVAIFRVQPHGNIYLTPCGFIRGHEEELPMAIAFQKDFPDGALLTIAWNSGRLQYFPIIFAQPGKDNNTRHQDFYRSSVKDTLHQDHYRSLVGPFPPVGDTSSSGLAFASCVASPGKEDTASAVDHEESMRLFSVY